MQGAFYRVELDSILNSKMVYILELNKFLIGSDTIYIREISIVLGVRVDKVY
jgi:hypothetical protein